MREEKKAAASDHLRQRLMDLAVLLERREGRRALAGMLREMGLARACGCGELPARNLALSFFERMRGASPQAAASLLMMIYYLEE